MLSLGKIWKIWSKIFFLGVSSDRLWEATLQVLDPAGRSGVGNMDGKIAEAYVIAQFPRGWRTDGPDRTVVM
jgi:hypothetical protein